MDGGVYRDPILPWLVGLAGQKAGFYDSVFGVALLTVATMLTLVVVVFWSGRHR